MTITSPSPPPSTPPEPPAEPTSADTTPADTEGDLGTDGDRLAISGSDDLSAGAITGIVLGSVAALSAGAGLSYLFCCAGGCGGGRMAMRKVKKEKPDGGGPSSADERI